MARANPNYKRLAANYLFSEVTRKTNAFEAAHPGIKVMRLSVGNTTEALPKEVITALENGVQKLSRVETYTGYGDEQGDGRLRTGIAKSYLEGGVSIAPDEIFVSDGAKPDSANIQSIFGLESIVALQDPSYPVYLDTNVLTGKGGRFNPETGQYEDFVYMPCTEQNGFAPELPNRKVDLIYLCSPNNPTGAVMTKEQLKRFVDFARESKAAIIFDAAYSPFIDKSSDLPRSIYEVEGAKECAIEINSFSKSAGFTGVRLGWTVVPKEMVVEDTVPGEINGLWNRRQCTFFNGASNIAQEGGLGALSGSGRLACKDVVEYYIGNANIIRNGLQGKGITVFGGENAPYVWAKTPNGIRSRDFFDKLLSEAHVACTPGVGFGPSGEGYARFSAFRHREDVLEAMRRIDSNLRV